MIEYTMAKTQRIQPSLSETEADLIDQVAAITRTKRTEVIKNALAVYHWFVRQVITGAKITARKPTGEEVTLETPELGVLESKASLLTPEEIGALARRLAEVGDDSEAERLKERLLRGFYGI
jgi:hypothetical protein